MKKKLWLNLRLGIGDFQAAMIPLAVTLAVAYEPLAEHELAILLTERTLLPPEGGMDLLQQCLAAIATMLTIASDPEGKDGYTLFHKSFRKHILESDGLKVTVETTRRAFAHAALNPEKCGEGIRRYLYRTGIDHLLDCGMEAEARAKLLDLDYLRKLSEVGKEESAIFAWWRKMGDEDRGGLYLEVVERALGGEVDRTRLGDVRRVCAICKYYRWDKILLKITKLSYKKHTEVLGELNEDTAMAAVWYGFALNVWDQFEEAENIFIKALAVQQKILGSHHGDVLMTMANLACLIEKKGDLDQAEELFSEVIRLRETFFEYDQIAILNDRSKLAYFLANKGDYFNAEIMCQDILKIQQRVLGEEHISTIQSMSSLARIQHNRGDLSSAEFLYRKTLSLSERILGGDHPDTIKKSCQLANVLFARGDLESAVNLLCEAGKLQEVLLGPKHPDTQDTFEDLAYIFCKNGDLLRAESLYNKLLKIRIKVLGKDHHKTIFTFRHLEKIWVVLDGRA